MHTLILNPIRRNPAQSLTLLRDQGVLQAIISPFMISTQTDTEKVVSERKASSLLTSLPALTPNPTPIPVASDYVLLQPSSISPAPVLSAVGSCHQKFWKTWESEGASLYIVQIAKEGLTLIFKSKPPLSRAPIVMESYSQIISPQAGSTGAETESSARNSVQSQQSRFLWQVVSGTQTRWQLAPNHRPVRVECIYTQPVLPHGNSFEHPGLIY